jgi:hypothetical protein
MNPTQIFEFARRRRCTATPTAARHRRTEDAQGNGSSPARRDCDGWVAMARCRVGPVRRAASDRWDPLVSDFWIKIHPG